MHLSASLSYPGADPDAVFAMITDRAFQERCCAATGSVAYEVDVVRSDDGSAEVRTTRTLPTDQAPEFVRRFVGGSMRVLGHIQWAAAADGGERRGTFSVEIAGVSVAVRGTVWLRTDGDGTRHDYDGDLKAAIPLIGGRVEKAVEPAIRSALAAEQNVGTAWLAGDDDD